MRYTQRTKKMMFDIACDILWELYLDNVDRPIVDKVRKLESAERVKDKKASRLCSVGTLRSKKKKGKTVK